jgi:drug/metabolite transporter (DMT)-like permease
MNKQFLPLNLILLVVLAFIWGSSYILMKWGLDAFSAVQVSMLRILFAFIALLPFLPKAIKTFNKSDVKYVVLVAVIGSGIPSYLYPLAITRVDSSVTGIINTLTPLFTMLFGWAFFKFKPTWVKVLGLVIALFGAGMLVVKAGSNKPLALDFYAMMAVLATVCYGLSSNVLKAKLNHVKAAPLTSLTFALIGPFALAILLSTNFIEVVQTHPQAHMSLIYIGVLGVLGTALALVLFNYLIKRTDALYASSVTFLMPAVAMFWGFIDKEQIGFTHVIGFILVLIGVYLTNRFKSST